MKELTRRQFLQGLAAGAAGIGIASVFPGLVPAADAASEPAGGKRLRAHLPAGFPVLRGIDHLFHVARLR